MKSACRFSFVAELDCIVLYTSQKLYPVIRKLPVHIIPSFILMKRIRIEILKFKFAYKSVFGREQIFFRFRKILLRSKIGEIRIWDAISICLVQSAPKINFGGECHVDFCREEKNDRVRLAITHICQSCANAQKERHYGKNKIK